MPISTVASGVFGLVKDAFATHELQQISSKLIRLSEQVDLLNKTTASVLHIASGTMALSGLNLALGAVSFSVLNGKLNKLDARLQQIGKDVVAIKQFLLSGQRTQLIKSLNALDALNITTAKNRDQFILTTRDTLAGLNLFYLGELENSSSLQAALAYEELYCLTALAQIRCSAELGEFKLATSELDGMSQSWKAQARRIADKLIVRDHPERFLSQEFAKEVPAARLAAWLDFTYDKDEGMGWVDELRTKSARYYQPRLRFGRPMHSGSLEQDNEELIPAMNRLVTRNGVFEGYRSQYAFLTKREIKPSEFEEAVSKVPPEARVDGFLILGGTSEQTEQTSEQTS